MQSNNSLTCRTLTMKTCEAQKKNDSVLGDGEKNKSTPRSTQTTNDNLVDIEKLTAIRHYCDTTWRLEIFASAIFMCGKHAECIGIFVFCDNGNSVETTTTTIGHRSSCPYGHGFYLFCREKKNVWPYGYGIIAFLCLLSFRCNVCMLLLPSHSTEAAHHRLMVTKRWW